MSVTIFTINRNDISKLFEMNQETLHKKILECSAKNKKALSAVVDQVSALKRQHSETENKKYEAYKSEYN